MSPYLASRSPATDTAEIRSSLRGYALADLPTVELSLMALKPAVPATRRRPPSRGVLWFAAPLAAGLLYVAQLAGVA